MAMLAYWQAASISHAVHLVEHAYEQLANRFRRVYKHLRKWARRTNVTCYRLYEKDIPDQPLIVDWYDGHAVVWAFDRTRNDTPADEELWIKNVTEAVCAGLDLTTEKVFIKRRFRQQDRQGGDGQYQRLQQIGYVRTVTEHGLLFEVNLSDYVDTGLFLDHRPTRQRVGKEAAGKDVLNLFAYTGAFSVHAAAGGAKSTTTVDLSNTYLEWAIRNLELNHIPLGNEHIVIRADCLQWLTDAVQEKQRYDIIICDPPTFSNSKSMTKTFRIDLEHPWLIARCVELLKPGGVLYFSTNFRGFIINTDELPPLEIADISSESVPEDFRNKKIHQCWHLTKPH